MLSAGVLIFIDIPILIIMQIMFHLKKVLVLRNLLFCALLFYISLILAITLFPIPYGWPEPGFIAAYNFIPFNDILLEFGVGFQAAVRNVGGNIVMFLPLGVILSLIFARKSWLKILWVSALCSAGIEFMQFLIGVTVAHWHYRGVNVDDVILNTVGAMIGFLIYKLIPQSLKEPFEKQPVQQCPAPAES